MILNFLISNGDGRTISEKNSENKNHFLGTLSEQNSVFFKFGTDNEIMKINKKLTAIVHKP